MIWEEMTYNSVPVRSNLSDELTYDDKYNTKTSEKIKNEFNEANSRVRKWN